MDLFVNYIVMILEALIYYRFMNLNMDFKYKHRSRLIVLVIILFTLFVRKELYDVNIPLWNTTMDTMLYAICLGIPFFFYAAPIVKKLILPIIYLLVVAIYEIIAIALTAFLMQRSMEEVRDHRSLTFYALSILLPVVVLLLLNLVYRKRKFDLTLSTDSRIETYVILISNILFIAFTAELWKLSANKTININMILPAMMSIIVINSILTMILLYKSYQRAEKQMENNLKMQQIEMENRLNKDMTEVMENLRGLRHDMNTHMGILKGLTDFEQYDELKKYLDSIYTDIKRSNSFIVVPHPALSILINSKISKANDLNIDFQPVVAFETIQMEDKDICALIGNMLENAIEASDKVISNKYIGFSIIEKSNSLFIHCENTYEVMPIRKGDSFLTSKKGARWHGIGMKNIQSIVKKYNGTMDIFFDELFVVDISVPCV